MDVIPTTSRAVAVTLRRAGILTVPGRLREGVYVHSGSPNQRRIVSISVQIDGDQGLADFVTEGIKDALDAAGLVYEHEQNEEGYHRFEVKGRPATNAEKGKT